MKERVHIKYQIVSPYSLAARMVTKCTLILFILATFFSCGKQKAFDKRITLNKNQTIPYGAYVAYHSLQKHFPNAMVYSERKEPGVWKNISEYDTKQALIIVCSYFNPSEEELDKLNEFVKNGNKVFISAVSYNSTAKSFFDVKADNNYFSTLSDLTSENISAGDSLTVSLDSVFQEPRIYTYPGVDYSNYFETSDSSTAYKLGYKKTDTLKANLLSLSSGKGIFILHAAPVTFTNFFILYKNNYTYYQKLLSLLGTDLDLIVWDEYFIHKRQEDDNNNGLLHVLLNYRNFKYAFWLALLIFFIFLYTEIKRRQRMIPVYRKPVNETLNFVQTVGKLYYEKGSHKDLAMKLTQLFFEHVRQTYKMPVNEINETFSKRLSAKSGANVDIIKKITEYYYKLNSSDEISEAQLMEYYHTLEKFYETTEK